MSTAVATPDVSDPLLSGKAHFYLRRLHSLTGLMFGGYLLVHLLVNATLIQGRGEAHAASAPTVFQAQVDKIHSLPFLPFIEYSMIILPLAFHTLYGLYVTFRGNNNVSNYNYGKNWAYTLQRISALIIFAFAFFHIVTMKGGMNWAGDAMGGFFHKLTFLPDQATISTVNHMHSAFWVGWIIYPIGILASTFHLSNGFWTGAITWGLTVSKQAQQRFGYVCAGIFLFTTVCGFAALYATLSAKPDPTFWDKQGHTELPFKSDRQ